MRIRWIGTPILGTFHNRPQGPKTGEVIELDDFHANRYIKHELAEAVDHDAEAPHF